MNGNSSSDVQKSREIGIVILGQCCHRKTECNGSPGHLTALADVFVSNRIGLHLRLRACRISPAIEPVTVPQQLNLPAVLAVAAQLAIELAAFLADGPEVFDG